MPALVAAWRTNVDAGTNRSFGGADRLRKRLKALSGTVYWYISQGRPTRKRWIAAKRNGERISLDDLGPPVRARQAPENKRASGIRQSTEWSARKRTSPGIAYFPYLAVQAPDGQAGVYVPGQSHAVGIACAVKTIHNP